MKLKHYILSLSLMVLPGLLPAPDLPSGHDQFSLIDLMRSEIIRKDRDAFRENYNRFKQSLAYFESGNNWKEYNRYGYLGKYQFGRSALEATGYSHVNLEGFKVDPYIFSEEDQENAMDILLRLNESSLQDYIREYVGYILCDSILITRSGILAAAHLSGSANVKEFLETDGGRNPKDRMGTRLSDYLYRFSHP